ncbi:hypothetical protein UMZ34_23740 [Halopseudomonas pachastrellae]|nr:hypothetical protein UMZ34_23740 [Halopseudomonas pachastrellae]
MITKHYTVRYYRVQAHRDGKELDLLQFFDDIVKKQVATPAISLVEQSSDYQLRGVSVTDGMYSGHFVRFRDDLPIAGSRDHEEEKPVELAEGEEVIDKTTSLSTRRARRMSLRISQRWRVGLLRPWGDTWQRSLANKLWLWWLIW